MKKMPLNQIKANSKEELIEKIMEELMASGKHTKEEAIAIAYAEAKRRGYTDQVSIHESVADAFGKTNRLNNVLKVPVTLVAEMVQTYHIDELPWLKSKVGKDIQAVKVFKPYEELVKALKDLEDRNVKQIPFVMPHSSATFLSDQIPTNAKGWLKDSIKDSEVKGYIKDFSLDETNHKLKGWAYLPISQHDKEFIDQLERGEVINVSIGFICDFDYGGTFNGQQYALTQRNIQIGHLAGLVHARGKCPSGLCGLNQDAEKVVEHDHTAELYLSGIPHITQVHSVMVDIETTATYDPMSIWAPQVPINTSTNIESSSDIMPPTIEELQKALTDAQKTILDMQSSDIKKQLTDAQKVIADWQTKYDAIKVAKDAMEEETKKCGEKVKEKDAEIEKLKTISKDQLIAKLKPVYGDRVVTKGKKLDELCLHDLEVVADSVGIAIENALKTNGTPGKSPEADHQLKLTGQQPKPEGKRSATVSADDLKKMREEK